MPNSSALKYWRMTGYSEEDINQVARELDERTLFAIFHLTPGENMRVTLSSYLDKIKEGHGPATLDFFADIVHNWARNSLKGTIFVLLQDGIYRRLEPYSRRIPMLTFCRPKNDQYSLLIPDAAYYHSKGYQEELSKLRKVDQAIPWKYKKPTAFWRGAGSGKRITASGWKDVARVRLAMKSKELQDPDKLDAYISRIVSCNNPEYEEGVKDLDLVRELIPLIDFPKYRYNIDIDGEFSAWKSCFLKLSLLSVLLKVEGPYEQWYYRDIKPWEHFIPVRDDLTDLEEAIDWARAHDDECRQIAEASTVLMAGLTYYKEALNTGALIKDLIACQRDE